MSSDAPLIDLRGVGKAYRQYRHPRQRLLQAVIPVVTEGAYEYSKREIKVA